MANPVNGTTGAGNSTVDQTYTQAIDANGNGVNGSYVNGEPGATTDVARKLSDGLVRTPFDDVVVVGGFSGAYINAMSREFGSRQIKSMRYGYYSIGLRQVSGKLAASVSALTSEQANRSQPGRVTITVADASIFDVTDVISFAGVPGYASADATTAMQMVDLCARVCEVKIGVSVSGGTADQLVVQFLNAKTGQTITYSSTADTIIYIHGHAAAETDASTTPYAALPDRKEQYMQKFMVQSLISSVMEESDKEVKWGEAEINNLLMTQFLEDIEKAYLKGVKSYTFDKVTKLWTYTTSGIIEQLVEGGGTVKVLDKNNFDENAVLNLMTDIFVGNNGSETRYMLTGIEFAKMFFKIKDIDKYIDANSTERKLEYDWNRLRFFNYVVKNAPDPLFDKLGMRNYALILDRQYVERRYFRSMDETDLLLKETGKYDGKSTVWSEISSVILKYPQCHALVKVE